MTVEPPLHPRHEVGYRQSSTFLSGGSGFVPLLCRLLMETELGAGAGGLPFLCGLPEALDATGCGFT